MTAPRRIRTTNADPLNNWKLPIGHDMPRATVIRRAGGMCAQCGSTEEPQIDHIKPWSKGGTHSLDNLQLLCGPCNRAKGDRW